VTVEGRVWGLGLGLGHIEWFGRGVLGWSWAGLLLGSTWTRARRGNAEAVPHINV